MAVMIGGPLTRSAEMITEYQDENNEVLAL
jgi:hypothetical protein